MEFQLRESSPIPVPPLTTQFIKQKLLEKTERVCVYVLVATTWSTDSAIRHSASLVM